MGSFVPNALMRYPNLSPSAKLLWARLAQYSGENGACYPAQEVLADELGLKKRQIINLLQELASQGFIEVERTAAARLTGGHNHYYFLWHPIFEDTDVPAEPAEPAELSAELCTSEVQSLASPEVQNLAPPLKENPSKENQEQTTAGADTERRIYEFWIETMGLDAKKTKFDTNMRQRKVHARLAEGYSEADLRAAIVGCKLSPWHQGENPTGAIYSDLELICRNDANVRKFMAVAHKNASGHKYGRMAQVQEIRVTCGDAAAQALARSYGIEWETVDSGRLC